MSSYLFIVKSELPLVIQAFLGQTSSSEWVMQHHYNEPYQIQRQLFLYPLQIDPR